MWTVRSAILFGHRDPDHIWVLGSKSGPDNGPPPARHHHLCLHGPEWEGLQGVRKIDMDYAWSKGHTRQISCQLVPKSVCASFLGDFLDAELQPRD